MDKLAEIIFLVLGAVVCISLVFLCLFFVVMGADTPGPTRVTWWTLLMIILVTGAPACLAFVGLRRSLQLGRTLLRRNAYLSDERAEERRHRPISGQELLTAALVVGVLVTLIFLLSYVEPHGRSRP